MTRKIGVDLVQAHRAHLGNLLLVYAQRARVDTRGKYSAPLALAVAVAMIFAVHNVPQLLERSLIGRKAALFLQTARGSRRKLLPHFGMAGTAIGKHAAPQALKRTAAAQKQTGIFARAFQQKRLERLVQDALARMGVDTVHRANHAAILTHGKHLVNLIPCCSQYTSDMLLKGLDQLGCSIKNGLQVVLARVFHMKTRRARTRHLELGSERRADIVRRNLITMAGYG